MKQSGSSKKTIRRWRIKSSKYILRDRWLKVRADECITDDGVVISPYYVLEYPDWIHLVVLNDKDEIMIARQYRHALGKINYELPCGTIDATDKTPIAAAKRELLEETGFAGKFIKVAKMSANPATHANFIHIFLVTDPVKKSRPQEDPKEVLDFEFMSLKRVLDLIDRGKFSQALHLNSIVLAMRKAGKTTLSL
ncbi:MAG: NUDIX hydrolase [Candidatus Andersenbacteria bacterium]|nr:NUDIX hydrolase [bacterium]MDZ4225523.1 NUDIX hydrolase [Candidatus Andersenbacteria bacterium]